jgi:hypothetical protein
MEENYTPNGMLRRFINENKKDKTKHSWAPILEAHDEFTYIKIQCIYNILLNDYLPHH